MSDVTRLLDAVERGDPHAAEQLLPLVYEELRKLAAERMAQEKPGQTLQATALVHEAYVRLVDVDKAQLWNSWGPFFAPAAEAMRRILTPIRETNPGIPDWLVEITDNRRSRTGRLAQPGNFWSKARKGRESLG
jgi:hypothetical protein